MPPKGKITKEKIVSTALSLVQAQGEGTFNARNIARALNCSTQPVFSNFSSMESLRQEVIAAAERLYQTYAEREQANPDFPPYKAYGMAYIRFAVEQKQLFQLLFMRDRSTEELPQTSSLDDLMTGMVQSQTGASEDVAKLFHLEMWAFVHGIATIVATGYLELPADIISKMLTDEYQALMHRHGVK